jgi:hypothetical protein
LRDFALVLARLEARQHQRSTLGRQTRILVHGCSLPWCGN